jgi:beta-glucosidase
MLLSKFKLIYNSDKMKRILFSSQLIFLLSFFLFSIGSVQPQTSKASKLSIERKIDSLLAKMTIEEKFGQLNQIAGGGEWNTEHTSIGITKEQEDLVKKGLVGSFLSVVGAETTRKIQQIAVEKSRLKIPLMFGYDVIHGYRTIFPTPLAEACTWDPELLSQSARVAAIEASSSGLHWTFAPMVDIARDPRWGRIMEGSGEDPYLGSVIAAARVKGFQGEKLDAQGSILACAKHFAAYGGAEAGRDYNTVDISERTLREIYLPPFKAAVDAGVGSFMTSFNEIAGVPSTANRRLLTKILRDEWGFQGFVISDWTAVNELLMHGIAASRAEAGVLALKAGTDIDMVSEIYVKDLPALLREGRVSQATVDEAVRRVLRAKFKLGLFENPYRSSDIEREKRLILHPEHRELARKVAQESIVLLKNENDYLPLNETMRTIAVLGPLADNREELLGGWAALGKPENVVTVLEGIRQKVSAETKIVYAKGCEIDKECGSALSEAKNIASNADVAIVVVGEAAAMSAEAASRSNISLPGEQEQLIKIIQETGKPVIVVLMNGRPLAIPWVAENVPVILETWFLGVEAGNAIADVLFGDVNPSGKLTVSFPRSVGQIPIYYNHKNSGRPVSDDKYTSKYIDVLETPLYPFGFGLSYTTFAFDNLQVFPAKLKQNGELKITVDVTNTGKSEGEEVVQLYIQDKVASVTRPVKELKAFQKISLAPGEKKAVNFVITTQQLAFYNLEMKWGVEPGTFAVFVGGNSRDVLSSEFELSKEM